jgi:biotin transport system substrate-specific component
VKLKVQDVLNVALFSALTEIGAYICVPLPFSPVPITLQTLFTYMAGALLGSYLGALSQMIYVILRAVGLPTVTGFQVVVGPTGGYLIGFIIGAFVIGKFVEMRRNPSFQWLLVCMTAGTAVIYATGVLQLANWAGISVNEAFIIGVLPFIVGDTLKILVAAYMVVRVRKMLPL